MMRSQFRCIRCDVIKDHPDDRLGAPKWNEATKEAIGLCLDCGAKEPEEHPAQAAMDELALHASQITTLYDVLDHLSETKYLPIEWGRVEPKPLKINNEESNGNKSN